MKGTPAIYLGRIVEKKNFRAFIYGANGERRLVESWEEFEANMQSGIWFASVEDAEASKVKVELDEPELPEFEDKPKARAKPKPKPKAQPKPEKVEEPEEEVPADDLEDDGSVIEVKDDFLPKE